MGSAASIYSAIAATAAVAGTGYSVYASERANKKSQEAFDQQKEANARSEQEAASFYNESLAEAKKKDQTKEATTQAKASLRSDIGSMKGRRGTILTTPLGISGGTQSAGKTLLGA